EGLPEGPALELGESSLNVAAQVLRKRLPREVPDHGSQLVVGVEGEAMVDDPHLVLGVEQAVPGLPVRVVRDHVKKRDLDPRVAARGLLAQEVPAICVYEKLHRADSMGALAADDGGRDPGPSQCLAQLIGRDLTAVESAGRKVPQGRFATGGLVDGVQPVGWMRLQPGQEGVVRGPPQDAQQLHLGQVRQESLRLTPVRHPALRRSAGHRWRPGRGGRRGPWAGRSAGTGAGPRRARPPPAARTRPPAGGSTRSGPTAGLPGLFPEVTPESHLRLRPPGSPLARTSGEPRGTPGPSRRPAIPARPARARRSTGPDPLYRRPALPSSGADGRSGPEPGFFRRPESAFGPAPTRAGRSAACPARRRPRPRSRPPDRARRSPS